MALRALFISALLAAGMAGCIGSEPALLSSQEAIQSALAAHPDMALVGVYGVEGQGLVVEAPTRLAFQDDGMPDGRLGDGRLSSWVVGLQRDDRLLEVRVMADGRLGDSLESAMPHSTMDAHVYAANAHAVDSVTAVPRGLRHPCISESGLPRGGPLGYRYSYSLYNETTVTRHYYDVNYKVGSSVKSPEVDHLLDGLIEIDRIGWTKEPDTWAIAAIDMTPNSFHEATVARLTWDGHPIHETDDAGRRRCDSGEPVQPMRRYVFNSYHDGDDGDLRVPIPWSDGFDIGPRAARVRVILMAQGGGLHDDANARVAMGDGSPVFDGNAWRMKVLDSSQPIAGAWTIDVTPPDSDPTATIELDPLGIHEAYIQVSATSYDRPGP